MEVKKSSNVSVPEIIPLTKLQRYANNDLFINVFIGINSVKPALCMKEGVYEEPLLYSIYDIFKKMRLIYQHYNILELQKIIMNKSHNLRQHHILQINFIQIEHNIQGILHLT